MALSIFYVIILRSGIVFAEGWNIQVSTYIQTGYDISPSISPEERQAILDARTASTQNLQNSLKDIASIKKSNVTPKYLHEFKQHLTLQRQHLESHPLINSTHPIPTEVKNYYLELSSQIIESLKKQSLNSTELDKESIKKNSIYMHNFKKR